MPALKYYDAASGTYKEIFSGQKGEKGDKGDPGTDGQDGATGPPGGMGPLDALSDVVAPASTPVGKVLGTTGVGVWGAIDPPATGLSKVEADGYYVNNTGAESMAGPLTLAGAVTLSAGSVKAPFLESTGGVKAAGIVSDVTAPTAGTDGANKAYVDGRIWSGTQAQYNAIPVKDASVLYVVV